MSSTNDRSSAFISIVIPLTNAGSEIAPFLLKLSSFLEASFHHFEIVLVDNHSEDDTVEQVQALQKQLGNIQLYILNKRGDVELAIIAGLDNSIGDFIFTLEYETDPIELIPEYFSCMLQGNSFICGVRRDHCHGLYRWCDRQFSKILRATTGVQVPLGISNFRLYSRGVVGFINQNADRHVLLKILPFLATSKIKTVEYVPIRAQAKTQSRGMAISFLSSLTILLASSVAPLRLLTGMTLTVSFLSLLYAGYIIAVAIFKNHVVEGWVSIALPMAVMFFFISTILGVLAEYVFRMAQHVRNSPLYMISSESMSTAGDLQRRLNVVRKDGEFTELSGLPIAPRNMNERK